MTIRYRVDLSEVERIELQTLLRGGRHAARKLKRAQILLAVDAGMPDETFAQSLGVGGSTVYRPQPRSADRRGARAHPGRAGATRPGSCARSAANIAAASPRPRFV